MERPDEHPHGWREDAVVGEEFLWALNDTSPERFTLFVRLLNRITLESIPGRTFTDKIELLKLRASFQPLHQAHIFAILGRAINKEGAAAARATFIEGDDAAWESWVRRAFHGATDSYQSLWHARMKNREAHSYMKETRHRIAEALPVRPAELHTFGPYAPAGVRPLPEDVTAADYARLGAFGTSSPGEAALALSGLRRPTTPRAAALDEIERLGELTKHHTALHENVLRRVQPLFPLGRHWQDLPPTGYNPTTEHYETYEQIIEATTHPRADDLALQLILSIAARSQSPRMDAETLRASLTPLFKIARAHEETEDIALATRKNDDVGILTDIDTAMHLELLDWAEQHAPTHALTQLLASPRLELQAIKHAGNSMFLCSALRSPLRCVLRVSRDENGAITRLQTTLAENLARTDVPEQERGAPRIVTHAFLGITRTPNGSIALDDRAPHATEPLVRALAAHLEHGLRAPLSNEREPEGNTPRASWANDVFRHLRSEELRLLLALASQALLNAAATCDDATFTDPMAFQRWASGRFTLTELYPAHESIEDLNAHHRPAASTRPRAIPPAPLVAPNDTIEKRLIWSMANALIASTPRWIHNDPLWDHITAHSTSDVFASPAAPDPRQIFTQSKYRRTFFDSVLRPVIPLRTINSARAHVGTALKDGLIRATDDMYRRLVTRSITHARASRPSCIVTLIRDTTLADIDALRAHPVDGPEASTSFTKLLDDAMQSVENWCLEAAEKITRTQRESEAREPRTEQDGSVSEEFAKNTEAAEKVKSDKRLNRVLASIDDRLRVCLLAATEGRRVPVDALHALADPIPSTPSMRRTRARIEAVAALLDSTMPLSDATRRAIQRDPAQFAHALASILRGSFEFPEVEERLRTRDPRAFASVLKEILTTVTDVAVQDTLASLTIPEKESVRILGKTQEVIEGDALVDDGRTTASITAIYGAQRLSRVIAEEGIDVPAFPLAAIQAQARAALDFPPDATKHDVKDVLAEILMAGRSAEANDGAARSGLSRFTRHVRSIQANGRRLTKRIAGVTESYERWRRDSDAREAEIATLIAHHQNRATLPRALSARANALAASRRTREERFAKVLEEHRASLAKNDEDLREASSALEEFRILHVRHQSAAEARRRLRPLSNLIAILTTHPDPAGRTRTPKAPPADSRLQRRFSAVSVTSSDEKAWETQLDVASHVKLLLQPGLTTEQVSAVERFYTQHADALAVVLTRLSKDESLQTYVSHIVRLHLPARSSIVRAFWSQWLERTPVFATLSHTSPAFEAARTFGIIDLIIARQDGRDTQTIALADAAAILEASDQVERRVVRAINEYSDEAHEEATGVPRRATGRDTGYTSYRTVDSHPRLRIRD